MDTHSPVDVPDTDALLRESRALREDAGRLLRELRLVEQWREYGEVELTGSYRWDLMLGSDVDLYVVDPAVDLDLALGAFNRFVRRGEFLRFGFIDSVRGRPGWADVSVRVLQVVAAEPEYGAVPPGVDKPITLACRRRDYRRRRHRCRRLSAPGS